MTSGSARLRRRCTAAAVLVMVLVAGRVPSAAFATDPAATPAPITPTIEVVDEPFPDDAIAQGATFKVKGAGWPVGQLVQVEVCGSEARSGSSDCAVDAAQVVSVGDDGSFLARLSVVVPPAPCPCVIRAFSQDSTDVATAPVEIPGAPNEHPGDGTVTAPALRRLEVQQVELTGNDSFATWWGAPARRTLQFELVNTGTVAVNDVSITLTAGPVDDPNGFIPPVKVDRIEIGERRAFSVPIEFPALSFGDQLVRCTVNGTSQPTTFSAETTTHPWLLIIVPIVLLVQGLLLLIRNIARRRLHDEEVVGDAVPNAVADDALICVVEIEEPDPDGEGPEPATRHRTVVLQSIQAVQQLVLDSLQVDEQGDPIDGQAVINTITVLADADARVGMSYHACDALCDWIEAQFTDSEHPDTRALTLRRHVSPGGNTSPSAASGMGMVPLSVMVRAPHVRAFAS